MLVLVQIEKSFQEVEELVDTLASGDIAQAVKEINSFRYPADSVKLPVRLSILPLNPSGCVTGSYVYMA